MVPEQRRYSRVRVGPLIPVDLGSDTGGILVDLSEGGFRVRVVGRLETDRIVPVGLALYGKSTRMEASGKVAWVDESGTGGGVQFVDLPEGLHRQIKQWLAQNSPTSRIQQEEPAIRHETGEFELPASSAAQGHVTHGVPSWAADEPIAQEQPQGTVPSPESHAATPTFDSARSGAAPSASEYTYIPQTGDEAAKVDRPGFARSVELRDAWLKYSPTPESPTSDSQPSRKLIVRVAVGGALVVSLITSAALLYPHRGRIDELFGELRRRVVGETSP